jgi:GT2 family glycosyltransferase
VPDTSPAAVDPPAIAILTVAYHSHQALMELARDLLGQSERPSHWLIINNAPRTAPLTDTTLRSLPVRLIEGQEGQGFGAGCNRGFQWLEGRGWSGWVWLLNPDTRLPGGDELRDLRAALRSAPPDALLGTAVRSAAGPLEPSAGWIDPGLRFRRRRVTATHLERGEILHLDWLSGCSLCLRPSAHHPPARFDTAFPLYYEDMDLCLRLARRGAAVLWLPRPLIHHQRGEGSATPSSRRLRLSTISYLRFLARHCPAWVLWLRGLRLLLNTLVRLPLQPRRSLAVLSALGQAPQPPAP